MDIKDGKIWVQHDGAKVAIRAMYRQTNADQPAKAGVPEQDIVLASHSPMMRQYTEFAVG